MFDRFQNKISILLILALLILTIEPVATHLNTSYAATSTTEIRILEITESGTSDLQSILGSSSNPSYIIDTIKMKRFIALRDELDGKYDAVYIGKGVYNATQVQANERDHNTTAKENDMTNLKIRELTNAYISRGLPFIVYSQRDSSSTTTGNGALYQNVAGNLKSALLNYVKKNGTNPSVDSNRVPESNGVAPNVIIVGDTHLANKNNFLARTNLTADNIMRPRLNLTSKPIDYLVNQSSIYYAGDTLSYKFNIDNVANINQRNLVANLYIGIDNVIKFGADHLVYSKPITSITNNTLEFRLPKGYSGAHYWKLELVDKSNNNKDIATGVIRFRDQKTPIKVLQVLPNNGDSSSLLKSNNMKPAYLSSDDYQISITVTDITTFNNTGYLNLNGNYDMLIFGFVDEYNSKAPISATAAQKVKDFIGTGQSVMFTHDTVYDGRQEWITYFQDSTGQLNPKTNMGLSAPNTSTTTKKVNEGLLTRFPFNISNESSLINTTHNQYFRLNLEDEKLIPWYNITGGPRDNDDSWNHYYTYSYGNVTYSGTGHTNTNFPDWEQRLFVNTMYRAFIGSNHAPILDVKAPIAYASNNKIIPTYSDILVSYTAEDYDLNDNTLTHQITFKYKETGKTSWTTKVVQAPIDRATGETVIQSFANPLSNDGDLIVTISASDKYGAIVTKDIQVKIVKVTANIDVNRTLSSNVINNQVDKNVPVTMTYTLTPKPVAYQAGIDVSDLVIKKFAFTETLPANLSVTTTDMSSALSNKKRTGTITNGYTISGNLADIAYRRSGNYFIADPISFEVKVTPTENGNYALINSNLSFDDFTIVNGYTTVVPLSLQFPAQAFEAVTKITALELADTFIAKGEETKLNPVITPFEATNKALNWISSNPSIVSVDSMTGVIKGLAEGTATITATAKDGSNISASAKVTVYVPGLTLIGPETMNVGETKELKGILAGNEKAIAPFTWSVTDQNTKAKFVNLNTSSLTNTLNALNPGDITVTLTVNTDKGKTYTKSIKITIVQPVQLTLPAEIELGINQTTNASTMLTISPSNMTGAVKSLTNWSSSNSSIVSVDPTTGAITGLTNGSADITATYKLLPESTPVTATMKVNIIELTGPTEITIPVGASYNLKSKTNAFPSNLSATILGKLSWSDESSKDFISINPSTGILQGIKAGTETITVEYRQSPAGPVVTSRTIKVNTISLTLPSEIEIGIGDTFSYDLSKQIIIAPRKLKNVIVSNLQWSTSGSAVTVDSDGIVKGKNAGTQTITVKYQLNADSPVITRSIDVTVVDMKAPAEITLRKGGTFDLLSKLTLSPVSIATRLIWPSSPKYVVVSTGIISASAIGSENVTVSYKTNTGSTISTVTKVNVVDLAFQGQISLEQDQSYNLLSGPNAAQNLKISSSAEVRPKIINGLTWSTDNTAYLTINTDGTVTAIKPGKTVVTVTYAPIDGSTPIKSQVTIIVTKKKIVGDRY
ncbi:MAG: DUF5057 domain-containing protein [Candidatus Cohnella colombiensis]|uniref:DUF5057 domain-containing protein n=1 Tax=Candidatus Cohnella colombiensis TaxID=3121368 RepID=A0AA95ETZ8_9BACL|nr:MAG: DUF5057 domain-containing protein [Cohnella sp.]